MDTYTPPAFQPVDHRVPYRIPEVPAVAWSAGPSARRDWVSRLVLVGVLLIQAALSLQLRNTANTDEATTLVVGRAELAHLLHGAPLQTDLLRHYPGAAWFYPLLAGAGEAWDRVAGARLVGLVCALAATAVLYALTRRMFNERVALCAAGAYATLMPTVVTGFYACPDAMAVLLVALAAWVVVRTEAAPPVAVLAAAPFAALAVAAEYAALIVLPTLFLLAVLTGARHRSAGAALLRGLLLGAVSAALLLPFSGTERALTGLDDAFGRVLGDQTAGSVLWRAGTWSGLFLAVAVAGGVAYVRRERMNELPDTDPTRSPRVLRVLLVMLLCGTVLLVPGYQAHLQTSAAMFRHLGLGLFFAAPLVGLGITRLVGAHFRNPQLGILLWVVFMALGIQQSGQVFRSWPNGSALLSTLYPHVNAQGRYLTEVDGVPAYYLDMRTGPDQWTSARSATAAANVAAVRQGRYTLVVLDTAAPGPAARALAAAVASSADYRLLRSIDYLDPGGARQEYRVYAWSPARRRR